MKKIAHLLIKGHDFYCQIFLEDREAIEKRFFLLLSECVCMYECACNTKLKAAITLANFCVRLQQGKRTLKKPKSTRISQTSREGRGLCDGGLLGKLLFWHISHMF